MTSEEKRKQEHERDMFWKRRAAGHEELPPPGDIFGYTVFTGFEVVPNEVGGIIPMPQPTKTVP